MQAPTRHVPGGECREGCRPCCAAAAGAALAAGVAPTHAGGAEVLEQGPDERGEAAGIVALASATECQVRGTVQQACGQPAML